MSKEKPIERYTDYFSYEYFLAGGTNKMFPNLGNSCSTLVVVTGIYIG
jgi:hypothetical protein